MLVIRFFSISINFDFDEKKEKGIFIVDGNQPIPLKSEQFSIEKNLDSFYLLSDREWDSISGFIFLRRISFKTDSSQEVVFTPYGGESNRTDWFYLNKKEAVFFSRILNDGFLRSPLEEIWNKKIPRGGRSLKDLTSGVGLRVYRVTGEDQMVPLLPSLKATNKYLQVVPRTGCLPIVLGQYLELGGGDENISFSQVDLEEGDVKKLIIPSPEEGIKNFFKDYNLKGYLKHPLSSAGKKFLVSQLKSCEALRYVRLY